MNTKKRKEEAFITYEQSLEEEMESYAITNDDATIVDPEKRKILSQEFELYLKNSGLQIGFEIIMAEVIEKKVPQELIMTYTIYRLK